MRKCYFTTTCQKLESRVCMFCYYKIRYQYLIKKLVQIVSFSVCYDKGEKEEKFNSLNIHKNLYSFIFYSEAKLKFTPVHITLLLRLISCQYTEYKHSIILMSQLHSILHHNHFDIQKSIRLLVFFCPRNYFLQFVKVSMNQTAK